MANNKLQILRGSFINLPTLDVAEPAFTTDSGDQRLFIGDGSSNHEIMLDSRTKENQFKIGDTISLNNNAGDVELKNGDGSEFIKAVVGDLNVMKNTVLGDDSNDTVTFNAVSNSNLDMGENQIKNVADPTTPTDGANKRYVDNLASSGLNFLSAVNEKDVNDPSTLSPSDGDRYWIGQSGIGEWSGRELQVAQWSSATSSWTYTVTGIGDTAYVESEGLFYFIEDDGAGNPGGLSKMFTGIGNHADTHKVNGADPLPVSTTNDTDDGKGLSSFDSNSFSITGGHVTIKTDGVKAAQIDTGSSATQLNLDKLSGFASQAISFNGQNVTNVADPVSSQDAATMNYVDTQISIQAGSATFAGLTDTPSSLGSPNSIPTVNASGSALVFSDFGSFLEGTPSSGETTKAPTSGWAKAHEQSDHAHNSAGNPLLHTGSLIDCGTF